MSENLEHDARPVVVIVGGGVSGTLTAVNLLRQEETKIKIILIEPRAQAGLGLAYSTPCSEHLLNVRASGMSAFADDPGHFLKFAKEADATIDENTFVSRKFFGHYINSILEKSCIQAARRNVSFKHICSEVIDIERQEEYKIFLANGQTIQANAVVLALGNLSAKKPRWTANLSEGSENYLHDPWDNKRLQKIAPEQNVLIIGTGLTAIDKLVQLAEAGHKGKIYAISRHGLFPRPHTIKPSAAEKLSTHICASTKLTFGSVKTNARSASDWRNVIDGLRADTQKWWCGLEHKEQKRFLRHIQTYWDVHRHRMAPQISEIVEKLKTTGQLTLSAGRIQSFEEIDGQVKVVLRHRHQSHDTTIVVDRIINCTGPQSKLDTVDSLLLQNLQKRGLVQSHPLGAGIACTSDGAVIDKLGTPQQSLLAIGPMLKAQLLESVAVPELKIQARATSQRICAFLGK
ncbi:MAG: FAD/NAD(P)-binding protein [Candidatus Obscuribacterales bacterium]|nr:FAD/NAD(P)-binding protein [Candidatus Obscuribacterales bacterium]